VRFRKHVAVLADELGETVRGLEVALLAEGAAIVHSHLRMLQDPELHGCVARYWSGCGSRLRGDRPPHRGERQCPASRALGYPMIESAEAWCFVQDLTRQAAESLRHDELGFPLDTFTWAVSSTGWGELKHNEPTEHKVIREAASLLKSLESLLQMGCALPLAPQDAALWSSYIEFDDVVGARATVKNGAERVELVITWFVNGECVHRATSDSLTYTFDLATNGKHYCLAIGAQEREMTGAAARATAKP